MYHSIYAGGVGYCLFSLRFYQNPSGDKLRLHTFFVQPSTESRAAYSEPVIAAYFCSCNRKIDQCLISMGSKLDNRIKIWKRLLLDSGKRNRLINFRENKRSNVKVISPSYESLYDMIVVQDKEAVFPFASKVHIDEKGEEAYDSINQGNVKTDKTIGELQKTLKNLRLKTKTSIEEQGINILFLAFGLLKWKEHEKSSQVITSPLVLVPVQLTIESLTSPYVLRLYDDEIVVNPTLLHKLDNDFSIKFPEFDSARDNIKDYLDQIEKFVNIKDWTVDRSVNLSVFSFLKINMYKDLEINKDKLKASPVISAIAGDRESLECPENLNNFDHDGNTHPIDMFQVVDADSSQQDAILLSKAGKSFVLQGPPGTGKSQTITNIISEALADGKKILFVSEKMAALQVVYNRLASVGLSDFCITLHNHKANKKDILKELSNTLSIDKKRVREEALAQLNILERKRSQLNDYQRELHTPCSSLADTIFNVNGKLAKLDKSPDYIFDIENVEATTKQKLSERVYMLSELAKTIECATDKNDCNAWKGAKVKYVSNKLRHDIDSNVEYIVPLLSNIESALLECSKELGISATASLSGLDSVISLLNVAANSPGTLKKWVYEDSAEERLSNIEKHKALYESLAAHRHSIVTDYDKEILDLDYYPIMQRFRHSYDTVLRVFKREYHSDLKTLESYSSKRIKFTYEKALDLLNDLKVYHEKLDYVLSQEDDMLLLYEDYFHNENTDWNEIEKAVRFAGELRKVIDGDCVPEIFVERICRGDKTVLSVKGTLLKLTSLYDSVSPQLNWFFSLFEEPESFKDLSFVELSTKLLACKDNKHLLEEWIDYRNVREKCRTAGLSSYLQQVEENEIDAAEIVNVYLKRFYRLWLDAVLPQFPAVRNFRGRIQEQRIKEFCQLDKEQFKIAQARIRERIISKMPDFNSITSTKDEVGILKHELGKQRKLMPLRKLFRSIPNLLTALKPCFMMSPLSVSVFLDAESYNFDLVIFDEASQVHTEDALGAIMRGRQVIIVGDTKQLPPTNFFMASLGDEEYDVDKEEDNGDAPDAYDSILDEATAVLPERSLRWHYRSRHEHLIAFSNAKIYNHRLITFPSTLDKVSDFGVEYIYVEDGVYDRGGNKNNIMEAKRVADLVFDHFKRFPKRSLGVVTFSEAQQAAIDMAVRQKRYEDSRYENFFHEDRKEPFFIKNLENVQGDERDTIIFSIGYAKDSRGIMYMNFGPLSRDNGYRRLNVAITRAKYNVKLVGSIMPTDIDIEKVSSEGVKMLRSYIEFAQQGIVALQTELSYDSVPVFDSPFEESVYDFLVSKGYNVITQVGCSGFRIDMAVRNPLRSGEFVLGIECDGATYHSARTARERDRLRQAVLEDMGWSIYRIWSTDWIKNQKTEEKKLIEAIELALSGSKMNHTIEVPAPKIRIEEKLEKKECSADKNNGFADYVYADTQKMLNIPVFHAVKKVIEIEQPIHLDELCRRVAPLYGRKKISSFVVEDVRFILQNQLNGKVQIDKDSFVTIKGYVVSSARKSTDILRKIEYISQAELIEALRIVVGQSCGVQPKDLCVAVAKGLGYKRVTDNVLQYIEKAYELMHKKGEVREVNGKVILN